MANFRLRSSVLLSPITLEAFAAARQVDDPAGVPVYVDETADLASAAAGDVLPFPAVEDVGDRFIMGAVKRFRKLRLVIATAGTVGTATWRYFDGATWQTVAGLTDGTTQLKAAPGTYDVSFDRPAVEAAQVIDGSPALYWIGVQVATVYTVNPVLTQGWAIRGTPVPIPAKDAASSGELRLFLRNLDGANAAYLGPPGQEAATARVIPASGTLGPLEIDHEQALLKPPELWSDAASPGNVLVDIDVSP